jgi:hypothetical protein
MTDRENLCREFTELTGGHWHEDVKPEYCDGKLGGRCKIIRDSNPDYTNPADVLRVMMVRDDYDMFLRDGLQRRYWLQIDEFIEEYILKPDAMLKAAVSFLKEHLTK